MAPSAPDLVIVGTTLADWQTLLTLIRDAGWRAECEDGDRRTPLPTSAARLFGRDPAVYLWVWPAPDLQVIFRPRSADAMVADVHPDALRDGSAAFHDLVRLLGRTVGRRVAVYAGDNDRNPPILEYDADRDRITVAPDPDDDGPGSTVATLLMFGD